MKIEHKRTNKKRQAKQTQKDKHKQKHKKDKQPEGSARNPGGLTLLGALSVCCVCRVYVYIIIIYRALGFVGGVLALAVCVWLVGCLCGSLGFGLIVLIIITQLNNAGNLATVAAVVF